VIHDVSEARALAMKMARMAQHDFLTDLPNRMLLTDRMNQAIRMAQRSQTRVALLFVDLDRFKQVKSALGHEVGDEFGRSVSG
jgi:diguanylate cyclase (GGDEF)-like protein